MFGYIRTNKMELKHREILTYKGYYCGICMTLKKEYGNLSRLSLNFDTTFLQILLTSLYEPDDHGEMKRCISHPHKKEAVITNEISSYCSAMNIILTYYKLKDDISDDGSVKARVLMSMLGNAFEKARSRYPEKEKAVRENLEELSRLEKSGNSDIQEMADIFGYIMAELFDYRKDVFSKSMYQAGFYTGKYIYILDAFEDLEEDMKNGSYNPLSARAADESLKEETKQQLFFLLSCLSEELDRLPLLKNKGIIDNIVYSGIVQRLNKAMNEACNEEDIFDGNQRSI